MATALISQSSRTPWRNIASVCKNAAVFLDSNAAELLHWAGGLDMLGDCVGVYDVLTELSTVAKDFIATVCTPFNKDRNTCTHFNTRRTIRCVYVHMCLCVCVRVCVCM